MKKMKILAILFILSCFLPLMNTMAANGISYTVEIPGDSKEWYYTGFGYKKTIENFQYYYNSGALNAFGINENIQVRTWDGTYNSDWINAYKGQYVTWGENNSSQGNFMPGTYGLDVHRKTSGLKLTHSGTWYYNTIPPDLK